jgi:hypothetical protein
MAEWHAWTPAFAGVTKRDAGVTERGAGVTSLPGRPRAPLRHPRDGGTVVRNRKCWT